ncbi:uncharacterized protein A4U43_C09F16520 [Asparagus officinalis]|uniref:Uncharacterized protein n=1 Tax=Asparagus officinalis TaxID=4686 RepID=A0A5P1EB76_ASPOF|nr:uncharacterized protein A4U43_C09F16520 [Asparagus officinalis]
MRRRASIQRLEAERMMLRVLPSSVMPNYLAKFLMFLVPTRSMWAICLKITTRATPQADVTSMVLDMTASEDGSSRFQRLLPRSRPLR